MDEVRLLAEALGWELCPRDWDVAVVHAQCLHCNEPAIRDDHFIKEDYRLKATHTVHYKCFLEFQFT